MPSSIKKIAKGVLSLSPLPDIMIRRGATRWITSIAYHRICEIPGSSYPFDSALVSASPAEFERELRYLKRNFDLITVQQLAVGIASGSLPERPAVITFDDGYLDNYEQALPVLSSLHLSACFFLSTRLVGTSDIPWWDQVACCFQNAMVDRFPSPFGNTDAPYSSGRYLQATDVKQFIRMLKQVRWPDALRYLANLRALTSVDPSRHLERPLFMSWDQARAMVTAGMEIGGHTRTHPVLGKIEDETILKDEIIGGREDLCKELSLSPVAFSYPEGKPEAMSESADRAIIEAGFQISFSYIDELARRQTDQLWRLPRFHAEFGDDFSAFRLALARAESA